jgi:hypothetical protein
MGGYYLLTASAGRGWRLPALAQMGDAWPTSGAAASVYLVCKSRICLPNSFRAAAIAKCRASPAPHNARAVRQSDALGQSYRWQTCCNRWQNSCVRNLQKCWSWLVVALRSSRAAPQQWPSMRLEQESGAGERARTDQLPAAESAGPSGIAITQRMILGVALATRALPATCTNRIRHPKRARRSAHTPSQPPCHPSRSGAIRIQLPPATCQAAPAAPHHPPPLPTCPTAGCWRTPWAARPGAAPP